MPKSKTSRAVPRGDKIIPKADCSRRNEGCSGAYGGKRAKPFLLREDKGKPLENFWPCRKCRVLHCEGGQSVFCQTTGFLTLMPDGQVDYTWPQEKK